MNSEGTLETQISQNYIKHSGAYIQQQCHLLFDGCNTEQFLKACFIDSSLPSYYHTYALHSLIQIKRTHFRTTVHHKKEKDKLSQGQI